MHRFIILALLLLPLTVSAQTVNVVTANLQHGTGTDEITNYSRQVTILNTTLAGDLISVQERSTGNTGWNASLVAAGFVEAVYRENDAGQSDGPAIWYRSSRVQVDAVYNTGLTTGVNPTSGLDSIGWDGSTTVNKAAVAAKVTVAGRQFYFVATHLCWSACADSSGSTSSVQRVNQINSLLTWITATLTGGLDIVIAGDLNFGPDYPKAGGGLQKDLFTATYTDLWNAGMSAGTATAPWGDRDSDTVADMPVSDLGTRTHDTRRIDYFMLKTSASVLSLKSISVPDTRATCSVALTTGGSYKQCPDVDASELIDLPEDQGVKPSDHNWVKAVLNIAPPTPPTSYVANRTRNVYSEAALTGALDLTTGPHQAGYTFQETVLSSAYITRITDANTNPGRLGEWYAACDTAEARCINQDTTMFIFQELNSGQYHPFNWNKTARTFTRVGDTSLSNGGLVVTSVLNGGFATPSFSGKDPKVLYGTYATGDTAGSQFSLRRLDFTTVTSASTSIPYTDILDVDALYSAISGGGSLSGYLGSIGVSGVDAANDFIAIPMGPGSQDTWHYAVWFNTATSAYKVLDINSTPNRWWNSATSSWTNIGGTTGGWTLHNVKIAQDGRYVVLTSGTGAIPGGSYGDQARWDTTDNTLVITPLAYIGGHRSAGYGDIWTQYANGADSSQWIRRSLATMTSPTDLIAPLLSDPTSAPSYVAENPDFDEHSSSHNQRSAARYPLLTSTSRLNAYTGLSPKRPWTNEIIAIPNSGSGDPWRIAQHHSTLNYSAPANTYFYYAFGQVSPDGKWFIFSTNWDFTLTYAGGSDPNYDGAPCSGGVCKRTDVFMMELPLTATAGPRTCTWNAGCVTP